MQKIICFRRNFFFVKSEPVFFSTDFPPAVPPVLLGQGPPHVPNCHHQHLCGVQARPGSLEPESRGALPRQVPGGTSGRTFANVLGANLAHHLHLGDGLRGAEKPPPRVSNQIFMCVLVFFEKIIDRLTCSSSELFDFLCIQMKYVL